MSKRQPSRRSSCGSRFVRCVTLPFDVEVMRLTDVKDPVWPLSFGKRPIPMQMASTKPYRGLRRRVCQFAHCSSKDAHITSGNLLLDLNFLALGETRAIETATENKRQKNNNDDSQKLTRASP